MNNLGENLDKMAKVYEDKLKTTVSRHECKFITGRLELIQGLRSILWASENMDRFYETMREP